MPESGLQMTHGVAIDDDVIAFAFDMTPDPALAVSATGEIVRANRNWRDFDRSADELIGLRLKDLIPGNIADRILSPEICQSLPLTLELVKVELSFTVTYSFDIRISKINDLLILNFRLTSGQLPTNLANRIKNWDAALEAIPAPVFFKDANLVYRAANQAFLDYLGRSRAEIIGKDVFQISPREQAEIYQKADLDLLEQGGLQTYETSVIDKDGREKMVIFHKSLVRSNEDEIIGLIGIILDITDRKIAEQQAREKAAMLEAIVQNSYAHIFIKDMDGRYLHAGESFGHLFDWPPEQMIGKDDYEIFDKDVADKFVEADRHVLKTGEIMSFRDELVTPDGLKHHLTVKFAMRDGEHNPLGVGLIASDITDLTLAEEELRKSSEQLELEVARRTQELSEEIATRKQAEEELRNILYASPVAVGISKPGNGDLSFANASLCKLLGRSEEDLVGSSTLQFWPDISVRDQLLEEFNTFGRTEPIEIQIYRKEGELVWVLLSWTRLNINGETVIVSWLQEIEKIKNAEAVLQQSNEELESRVAERTQALKQEIEERLKVEEALREREQLLEAYAAASSDWFWGMDKEFKYNSISDKFEILTGLGVDTVLGNHRWDFVTPTDTDVDDRQFWDAHRAVLESHEPFRDLPIKIKRPDGSILYTLSSGVPTFDKDNEFSGYLGIARDVTDAVKARLRAENMENQLRQSQKMEAIGQLTGGIAHDFNNILAIILGNAELMQELVPHDDPLQRYLDSIDRSANRGAQLTQRLLAYSRKQELRPEKLNMNELIANIGELVDRLISEEIEVIYNFNTNTAFVLADPSQLENAFVNLCINARDAMPEGGQLEIKTNNLVVDKNNQEKYADLTPGHYSYLCVTDTGKGMDEDTLAHVFEPFFTTKETGKGTGLGLSMIYGFARQSGGTVTMESKPGKGTRARLILPSVTQN